MKDVVAKYDAVAERYSATDYADPDRYYGRRARAVVELGPRLALGDVVLDFACGDGALGSQLVGLGIDYRGVDASAGMVRVAERTIPGRVTLGDFDYTPPEPVDAATIFRSLYLVHDRRAFLAHLHEFAQEDRLRLRSARICGGGCAGRRRRCGLARRRRSTVPASPATPGAGAAGVAARGARAATRVATADPPAAPAARQRAGVNDHPT